MMKRETKARITLYAVLAALSLCAAGCSWWNGTPAIQGNAGPAITSDAPALTNGDRVIQAGADAAQAAAQVAVPGPIGFVLSTAIGALAGWITGHKRGFNVRTALQDVIDSNWDDGHNYAINAPPAPGSKA